jgi:hypothetical protein
MLEANFRNEKKSVDVQKRYSRAPEDKKKWGKKNLKVYSLHEKATDFLSQLHTLKSTGFRTKRKMPYLKSKRN